MIELHGNLLRLKSFVDEEAAFAAEPPPVICPVCDGYAVWEHCDPWAAHADLLAIELRAGRVPRCRDSRHCRRSIAKVVRNDLAGALNLCLRLSWRRYPLRTLLVPRQDAGQDRS